MNRMDVISSLRIPFKSVGLFQEERHDSGLDLLERQQMKLQGI